MRLSQMNTSKQRTSDQFHGHAISTTYKDVSIRSKYARQTNKQTNKPTNQPTNQPINQPNKRQREDIRKRTVLYHRISTTRMYTCIRSK